MRNEENLREGKLSEALSCMHAPDDLYENVVARAAGGRRHRHGHARPLMAVAAAALIGVLAMGGTAYAVVSSGFFQRAWGSQGNGDVVRWTMDTGHGTLRFNKKFGGVNPEDLSDSLADAVEPVGYAVKANGYTLTVENVLVDENGAGAATFTLENPDGVKYHPEYGAPGELVFNGEDTGDGDLALLRARWGGEQSAPSRATYDVDTATSTKLHGTIYFAADNPDSVSKGISWVMGFNGKDGGLDAATDVFRPTKYVPVHTFSDDEGHAVEVSPLAVMVDPDVSLGAEPLVDHVSLQLANGKEIVVADDGSGALNYHTASILSDNTVAYTSSQLIDADSVTAVHLTLRTCEGDTKTVRDFELTPER